MSIHHTFSITNFQKNPSNGYFSSSLKDSTVVPLFKKGDKSQVSNYRPVSLLATAGKFFEAIIFKRLYDHCSPLFSKSQFGFRKNRSTVLQLITFLQKVYKGIETNNDIDLIFTDFSKAFDKVDHGILFQKLYRIGIRGQIFNVLQSFITGRTQKVRVMNELSNEFKLSSGVPQGSLLSPLLFLIFINDLPDICNQMIPLLFADDAKFLSIGLKSENIQHDLNQLYEWTSLNKLPLILYYTILYYTILYYTILYYTILYYTILYYTILYYTILYYTILYYTILYYTILYYTILYYTILYYTILYYTILYYTILYYTILYYTILYYTILYYTILYEFSILRLINRSDQIRSTVDLN